MFYDEDPYLWLTLNPGHKVYWESNRLVNTLSGDVATHLLVPRSASSLKIDAHDDDRLRVDPLLGSYTIDISSFNFDTCADQACTLTANLMDTCNFCWTSPYVAGTLDIEVRTSVDGEDCAATTTHAVKSALGRASSAPTAVKAMCAKMDSLNAAGTELTEAWTSRDGVVDFSTFLTFASQQFRNAGYLAFGNVGDSANEPVSGIWDYQNQFAFDGGKFAAGPGDRTVSIFSWSYAKASMQALAGQLVGNDRHRRNELGLAPFNGKPWPEKPNHAIGLGDNLIDHARARLLLDEVVGPAMAMSQATKDVVRAEAEAFWAADHADMDIPLGVWNIKLLHKFHLDMQISDDDAREFIARQFGFLTLASTNDAAVQLATSYSEQDLLTYKAGRLDLYRAAIERRFPTLWAGLSTLERTKLASAVMDSLLFAGGISVPTVGRFALAMLYSEYAQQQLGVDFAASQFDEAKIDQFAMEVIRRFPPVAGFPSWDRETNLHTIVDLLMVQADTEDADGWGPTARDFVLRPMAEYHSKSMAWADFANVGGDSGNPHSHVCPAKDLSFLMVRELLRGFVRRGGYRCWETSVHFSDVSMNGYTATKLNLSHVGGVCTDGMRGREDIKHLLPKPGRSVTSPVTNALHFDVYTETIIYLLKGLLDSHSYPTAKALTAPAEQLTLPRMTLELAPVITLPDFSEPDGGFNVEDLHPELPFPDTTGGCGTWSGSSDPPVVQLRNQMQGTWPVWRELTPWTTAAYSYSDAGLEDFVMRGLGQHRLRAVRSGRWAGVPVPSALGSSAAYAVYTNFAASLQTRGDFAALGADCYFDANGKVLGIWRGSTLSVPGSSGWEAAKFAFRSTLLTVVTAVDHLYWTHLTVANALATAAVEQLPANHPVRRLMAPHVWRTFGINQAAAQRLLNKRGMLHRATPLTEAGLTALFAWADGESTLTTLATPMEHRDARGVGSLNLPFDVDGVDFFAVVRNYVRSYLSLYYTYSQDACGADASVRNFLAAANTILPRHDLPNLATAPAGTSCDVLEKELATFIYTVTAYHNHVGTIAADAGDPCFSGTSWVEGESCALPRTSFTQASIMATTGVEQPKLLDDYSHLFLDDNAKAAWASFTAELHTFDTIIKSRNSQRSRPFRSFEPEMLEVSVGV